VRYHPVHQRISQKVNPYVSAEMIATGHFAWDMGIRLCAIALYFSVFLEE